jgi:hypothetical protein
VNQLRSWARRIRRWFVQPDQPREWLVEGDGRPLARLVEPSSGANAFWVRWRVLPFADAGAALFDPGLWASGKLTLRDPRTGLVAPNAFSAGGDPPARRGSLIEVSMRALHLTEDEWRRLDGLP